MFHGEAEVAQLVVALFRVAQPRVLLASAVECRQVIVAVEAEALRQQLVEAHAPAVREHPSKMEKGRHEEGRIGTRSEATLYTAYITSVAPACLSGKGYDDGIWVWGSGRSDAVGRLLNGTS